MNNDIILLIGAYFILMGLWILIRNHKVRNWESTRGILLDQHIGSPRKSIDNFNITDYVYERQISAHVKYKYEVNNISYENDRLSFIVIYGSRAVRKLILKQFDAIELLPDNSVTVFYKLSNPKQSVLIKPNFYNDLTGLVLCFIGLLFIF